MRLMPGGMMGRDAGGSGGDSGGEALAVAALFHLRHQHFALHGSVRVGRAGAAAHQHAQKHVHLGKAALGCGPGQSIGKGHELVAHDGVVHDGPAMIEKPQRDGNKCQPGHRHSIKPDSGWEPPLSGKLWLHTSKILILQDCNVSIDIEGFWLRWTPFGHFCCPIHRELRTSALMERLPATYSFRHHRGLDNFCQDGKHYSPELQTGFSLHPR